MAIRRYLTRITGTGALGYQPDAATLAEHPEDLARVKEPDPFRSVARDLLDSLGVAYQARDFRVWEDNITNRGAMMIRVDVTPAQHSQIVALSGVRAITKTTLNSIITNFIGPEGGDEKNPDDDQLGRLRRIHKRRRDRVRRKRLEARAA